MTARTLLTPADTAEATPVDGDGLEFEKQILPEGSIDYKGRKITFDRPYLAGLVQTHQANPFGQVPLLLDGPKAHDAQDVTTGALRDPERYRGEVTGLRLAGEGERPGLYARLKFATPEGAKLVRDNPRLGVSARIIEGLTRDGRTVGNALRHVLATLSPRVVGLSDWQAVSLASEEDEIGDVLDFTAAEYSDVQEEPVANDDPEFVELSDEEIDQALADAAALNQEPPVIVSLSVEDRNAIDLAVADAEQARAEARAARTELAGQKWRGDRLQLAHAGVPASMLDLAEPLLSLPDSHVIDLADGDSVDPAVIVRGLLDEAKGTVDLSDPLGHGGGDDSEDVAISTGGDPRAKLDSNSWPTF